MTSSQRGALHLWFDTVSDLLNESGVDQAVALTKLSEREAITFNWTAAGFKENVFKPCLMAVSAVNSTENMDNNDIDVVVTGLQKWAASELQVVLPDLPRESK
jgi:hypothetical protein|tara:strand:- start:3336 stop:3644 length:309 start_codon:yes stop_codon:yes gene_type:complete